LCEAASTPLTKHRRLCYVRKNAVAKPIGVAIYLTNARSLKDERYFRLYAPEGLDLEQGEWRPIRQHQPPDIRADA
jgi:hypothetical protein